MSSSSANASSGSQLPRLGPAWLRGGAGNQGGRGFQPPPPVPSERLSRSSSIGSSGSNEDKYVPKVSNKFSVLDDDDDLPGNGDLTAAETTTATSSSRFPSSRSEGLRSSSRPSGVGPSNRPTGRSLADLAARAPPPGVGERSSSSSRHRREPHGGSGGTSDEGGGTGRFSSLKGESPEFSSKVIIRYTREKLLSIRPQPRSELLEQLKHLAGTPIISKTAQDPVCWDTFDADEIWAQAARERGPRGLKPPPMGERGALGTLGDSRRGSGGGGGGGRWQRGVALPPPDESRARGGAPRGVDAEHPGDLWDDPVGGATGAATDFSSFGAIPDDPKARAGVAGAFDFNEMAEASRQFEEELHGKPGDSEGEDGTPQSHSVKVDPKRPLAAAGTTIRSGSGDDFNVFEDFDDDEGGPDAAPGEPIKSGEEEPSASSRLMKMIGVKSEAKKEEKEGGAVSAWGGADVAGKEVQSPAAAAGIGALSSAIPRNPWGGPILPAAGGATQQQEGMDLALRLDAAVAEQKAREAAQAEMEKRRQLEEAEMHRRREGDEEAQRRAAAQAQQAQARQQATMQQEAAGGAGQGPSQVELVLMERISNILENSWGRSDLMSILTTLHSQDSRVIPLLGNAAALRALIARHPRRIGLRNDPSFGAEMAVLLLTNAQWQQQEQARAQQEEMQRRQQQQQQQQQRLDAMQRQQAAAARAHAEAQERASAQQQKIAPDAPWFYADPQNNIQGPFKGDEMRQWLEAGYFKGDLPISQQPAGPFRQLSQIFPDLSTAFQAPGPSPADKEEQARAAAEEENRAKEAEAARVAADAERQRQEREAAKEAAKMAQEQQNESSTQLKVLLGLGESAEKVKDDTVGEVQEEPVSKRASASSASQQQQQPEKRKTGKSAKSQQRQAAANAPVPASAPAVQSAAPARSSPVAWGGAASAGPKRKSMSEIQQEEARSAAILAMEKQSQPRSSSSGWANVAARGGGSTGWASGTVKPTPSAAVVTNPPAAATSSARVATPQARATKPTQVAAATQKQAAAAQQQQQRSNVQKANAQKAGDEFGAGGRMSPSLEMWCKEQMRKLNGSEDLTLVSFCMTLTDDEEIKEYLTAYLGNTPQVNNFAAEFLKRRDGKKEQEEWESAATTKKGRKKKSAAK